MSEQFIQGIREMAQKLRHLCAIQDLDLVLYCPPELYEPVNDALNENTLDGISLEKSDILDVGIVDDKVVGDLWMRPANKQATQNFVLPMEIVRYNAGSNL